MDDEGESNGCANFVFLNQVKEREGEAALTEEDKRKITHEAYLVAAPPTEEGEDEKETR